jgi:hypothetical protein
MSLHKLSAGCGYDYLIRQVAALDATYGGGRIWPVTTPSGVRRRVGGWAADWPESTASTLGMW